MAVSGIVHVSVKHGSKWYFKEHTDLTPTGALVASTLLGMAAGALTALFTGPATVGADPAAGIGMGLVEAICDGDLWAAVGGGPDVADTTDLMDGAGADDVHFGARYNGVDRWGRPVEADGFGELIPRDSQTQRPVDPTTVTWDPAPSPPPAPEPPTASVA